MSDHRMTWTDDKGRSFDESVPDIWLAGFCTSNKCDVETSLAYWRQQSEWGRTADEEGDWRDENGMDQTEPNLARGRG
jgi:hypothetical protein